MITYETLRKISMQERESNKLSQLPPNFFSDVQAYFSKKSQVKTEESWEFESARQFFQEILDRREAKILMHALYNVRSGLVPENMSESETEFFSKIVKCINEFKDVKKSMTRERQIDTVAILEPLPEFVGLDMKTYGPFSKGDVTTLPKDVAELLVSKKSAEKIKV
jgi:DNA replication initiation complex subunit (GINS family)